MSLPSPQTNIFMYQPAPEKTYTGPTIRVNGEKLKAIERITYLGSNISQNVTIGGGVNTRIAKASYSIARLYNKVWHRDGITLQTKLKVHRAAKLLAMLMHVKHGPYTSVTQRNSFLFTQSVSAR